MSISFASVAKSFGDHLVLNSITYTFEAGKRYIITGASGAGKTTLLRLMASLDFPTAGQITGTPKSISYAFQEPRLFPQRTVLENIIAITKEQYPFVLAEKILAELDLIDAKDQYPEELSGGMQKRAALARALAFPADLYLFDEPTGGQDQKNIVRIAKAIENRTGGATVVIATHDEYLKALLPGEIISI